MWNRGLGAKIGRAHDGMAVMGGDLVGCEGKVVKSEFVDDTVEILSAHVAANEGEPLGERPLAGTRERGDSPRTLLPGATRSLTVAAFETEGLLVAESRVRSVARPNTHWVKSSTVVLCPGTAASGLSSVIKGQPSDSARAMYAASYAVQL